MKQECFDEGTMQAFLDGELSTQLLEKVARHVATCEPCAVLLQETEEESAFAFAALDNEINSLVPTERIRANLYQAISEIEKPKTSIWQKFLSLGAIFANPSIAAFAGLVIVFGIVGILWSSANQTPNFTTGEVAGNYNQSGNVGTTSSPVNIPIKVVNPKNEPAPQQVIYQPKNATQVRFQNANYKLQESNSNIQKNKTGDNKLVPPAVETISGEDTYIKTIATLTETVNGQKDQTLRPSARVSFDYAACPSGDSRTGDIRGGVASRFHSAHVRFAVDQRERRPRCAPRSRSLV